MISSTRFSLLPVDFLVLSLRPSDKCPRGFFNHAGKFFWTRFEYTSVNEQVVKGEEMVDGKFSDTTLQEETGVTGVESGTVEHSLDDTPLCFEKI